MATWRAVVLSAAAGSAGMGAWTAAAQGDVEPHVPTELPGPGWPGPSAEESQGLWPSGHQPGRHEAWPQRRGAGTGQRTLLPCWKTAVLADHGQGWPGSCLELFQAKGVSSASACEALCLAEPRCPVWQFVNQTSPGQCWVGNGKSCVGRGGSLNTITVQGAQRIMHGDVRVLQNMSGWKIQGLYQLGDLTQRGAESSVERCRRWCYSDIHCQYWQYGPGGCWVDAPLFSTQHGTHNGDVVQYPLTTDGGATNRGYEAEHMRWGEYIQHYCPPQPGEGPILTELPPEKPEPRGGAPSGRLGTSAGGSLAVQLLGSGWTWAPPALACLFLVGCACGLLWTAARARRESGRMQAQRGPLPSTRDPAPVPVGEEPWPKPLQQRAFGGRDDADAAAGASDYGDGRVPQGDSARSLYADQAPLLRQPCAAIGAAADAAASRAADGAGRAADPWATPPCLAPPGPGFGPRPGFGPQPGFGPPPGPPRGLAGPPPVPGAVPGQAAGLRPPALLSPSLVQPSFPPVGPVGPVPARGARVMYA